MGSHILHTPLGLVLQDILRLTVVIACVCSCVHMGVEVIVVRMSLLGVTLPCCLETGSLGDLG